ncbi:SnoaL-like domain-containing protein [Podospora aff. communis PSN243]|uniref:SnoaL-like domain-containing protein n=1 Tax=Podospora aff. communis PSN243 TaxID=3040156 RepID=A0AAV9G6B8_9PEZI|nr:SnoaL-like domain-containing protein [Podospora aff. communis PSN243]
MKPLTLLLAATAAGAASPPTLPSLSHALTLTESLRAIKDLTSTFAHLSQSFSYAEMASLFTPTGTLHWGNLSYTNHTSITSFLSKPLSPNSTPSPNSSPSPSPNSNSNPAPLKLDTLILATPLLNLSPSGLTAQARYNGWRFQGDGKGGTLLQGGIYENEYRLSTETGKWGIEVMRYYPHYEGTYEEGWRNVGGGDFGAVPPFHYTPDEAGVPIPRVLADGVGKRVGEGVSLEGVRNRVEVLVDEDEVRNLQHAWGYYLDRRMWDDVVDLFGEKGEGVLEVDNVGAWKGKEGVRKGLERWMGPAGLERGVLNEHLIFNTMVHVREAGKTADSRGIEVALIGDRATNRSEWRIGYFQNSFVKRNGIWQFENVTIVPLVVANFSTGWGKGSLLPRSTVTPKLLPYTRSRKSTPSNATATESELAELHRQERRAAAYDGAENVINAYGFYIDYIDGAGCFNMSAVHHTKAHKASPFTGFYQTQKRVLDACTASYGTASQATRSSISFHWRPQPVILVSADGRSASVRARLLQPATSKGVGSAQIRGGMYHDQAVLDEDGIWRLWSITIDEFYWNTGRWSTGWGGVEPRPANASNPGPRDLTSKYPPDLILTEMGERERGFQGGTGRFTAWPDILKMWFMYRNLVSGREPKTENDGYWPGCVPCQHRPEWAMEKHGWQEPPTGPPFRG